QVEPAGAGVPLPTGAATELVVDPAGLMALGADNVQPALGGHTAAFLRHLLLRFDLLDRALPLVRGNIQAGLVLVLQPGPGQRFRVAAEDDVGAATGHVGGDGHRSDPAG